MRRRFCGSATVKITARERPMLGRHHAPHHATERSGEKVNGRPWPRLLDSDLNLIARTPIGFGLYDLEVPVAVNQACKVCEVAVVHGSRKLWKVFEDSRGSERKVLAREP